MLANFIPIWFIHGMRGNSIYRILAAHPEVYWDSKSQIDKSVNSLHVSNNITSIDGIDLTSDIANRIGMWKKGYTTYHSCSMFIQPCFIDILRRWSTTDKLLFGLVNPCIPPVIKKQDTDIYQSNEDLGISAEAYKLIDPSRPHIWIHGSRNRLQLPYLYVEPSIEPSAYNLNIDNLFSTDYITFETEYFKLIAHFNLTSRLNAVRAFILLSLEREQYISNFI
jgi:hypothetical protein